MSTPLIQTTDLFSYTSMAAGQMEGFAQRAVSHGLDLFVGKKYDEAIKEFRRAVGLAPNSSLAVDAYNQIAQSYAQKNDSQGAIDAYKQSLRMAPNRADTHVALGNVYYFEKRYQEAEQAYAQAVRIDPSAGNRFSLGQANLANGKFADAEMQFRRVRDVAPNEPSGSYGLGQVAARQGRHAEAIEWFQDAIAVQRDFWDGYVEMGYVYADLGQIDEANKLADFLADSDPARAATLSAYVYQKTPPNLIATTSSSSFPYAMSAGSLVSALDSYLATAEATRTFSMVFQFNKEMERESVENVLNWQIARSIGTGLGDNYNFGLAVPSSEITVPPHPVGVNYDPIYRTATVWFELRQNASADGTIDPSHIQFTFSGKDRFGMTMDGKADQFMGMRGVA